MPYEFPFIDDGVDWNCFHWYIDLKESSSRERERERRGKSVLRSHRGSSSPDTTTKQDLFGYTTTIRPLLLLLPKFQAIRSWRSGWRLPRKSSTNAKKKEHGGYMDVWIMKWGWYLEYFIRMIRIEYTWYWEWVLLLLCSCMKICIIDWL